MQVLYSNDWLRGVSGSHNAMRHVTTGVQIATAVAVNVACKSHYCGVLVVTARDFRRFDCISL